MSRMMAAQVKLESVLFGSIGQTFLANAFFLKWLAKQAKRNFAE